MSFYLNPFAPVDTTGAESPEPFAERSKSARLPRDGEWWAFSNIITLLDYSMAVQQCGISNWIMLFSCCLCNVHNFFKESLACKVIGKKFTAFFFFKENLLLCQKLAWISSRTSTSMLDYSLCGFRFLFVVLFLFQFFCVLGPSCGIGSGDAWDMFKRRSWSLGRDKRKHHNKGLLSPYYSQSLLTFASLVISVWLANVFRFLVIDS